MGYAVHNESWRVASILCVFIGSDDKFMNFFDKVYTGGDDRYELDQLHERGRIKKLDPQYPSGFCSGGGDRGNRKRRSIGGKDAIFGDDLFELCENFFLYFKILYNGFDNEAARGEFL